MKKQLQNSCIIMLFLLLHHSVKAQYIAESFEGPVFPPPGWVLLNPNYGETWRLNDNNSATNGQNSIELLRTPASAWLICKGIQLDGGTTIEIKYDYKAEFTYVDGADPINIPLKVSVGAEPNVEAQNNIIQELNTTQEINSGNNLFITETISYTVPESGIYYFSFSCETPFNTVSNSALEVLGGGDYGDKYHLSIDKIIIQSNNNCPIPDNIISSTVSGTSETLSWDSDNSISNWQIQVFKPYYEEQLPQEEDWININTSPYTITGLNPGTDYKAYIRSICSTGGYSDFSEPVNFTTICPEAVTAPYTLNFAAKHTPGCWQESGDTNWKYNTSADYAARQTGDHTLLQGYTNYAWVDGSENTNEENAILTSPNINVSELDNPALEFYVFSENEDNEAFNIFHTEVYNGNAWQTVATLTTETNGWKFYSIDLSEYEISDTTKARFTVIGNNENGETYYNDILLDDVAFKEKTSCFPIQGLTFNSIIDNQATISWDDLENSDSYGIVYGSYNFIFTGEADLTNVNNPYTIENLEPDTLYDIYISSNCGDNTTWSGPYTFMTNCPIYTPDYEENFLSNTLLPDSYDYPGLPECWNIAGDGDETTGPLNTGGGNWKAGQNSVGPDGYSGSAKYLFSETYNNSWLLSPLFNLSENQYELKITIALTHVTIYDPFLVSMGSDDEVKLLYTEDEQTWHSLKMWSAEDNLTTGEYSYIIPLDNIDGENVRFAFWATSGNIDDQTLTTFRVKNIKIREKVNCPEPLNIQADGITGTTAKLKWDNFDTNNTWQVAVVPEGTIPTIGDWNSTSENPTEILNLSPNTSYDAYLKTICGGIESEIHTGPYTFTTRCASPITAPYVETFANQGAPPSCWIAKPEPVVFVGPLYFWNFNTNASFEAAEAGDHTPGGGTGYAWLDGTLILSSGEKTFLETSIIDISSLQHPALQFYVYSKNSYDDAINQLQVEIYDGNQWQEVTTLTTTTNNWTPITIDLSQYNLSNLTEAKFTTIAQTNEGNLAYNDLLIDDVGFIEMPDCVSPFNITIDEVTTQTAQISWQTAGENTNWKVEYGPIGFTPGEGTIVNANETPQATLTNLSPNTSYEVYISSLCNEEELIGPSAFTTETLNVSPVKNTWQLDYYPNPVTSSLHLDSKVSLDQITIYDLRGRIIWDNKNILSNEHIIDVSSWNTGVYLIRIKKGINKKVYKIIKY